ncbi:hypothetical protein GE061_020251 [Apolygus lucorum]|uniref:CCHC-type domain-containing protein n=1 Tax=Apolygus lucorum TaxID=248454 RepID=A0A8S9WJR7_APOLU|nr:hypothetical protein GE061_020251 [Apolygus lucorum]
MSNRDGNLSNMDDDRRLSQVNKPGGVQNVSFIGNTLMRSPPLTPGGSKGPTQKSDPAKKRKADSQREDEYEAYMKPMDELQESVQQISEYIVSAESKLNKVQINLLEGILGKITASATRILADNTYLAGQLRAYREVCLREHTSTSSNSYSPIMRTVEAIREDLKGCKADPAGAETLLAIKQMSERFVELREKDGTPNKDETGEWRMDRADWRKKARTEKKLSYAAAVEGGGQPQLEKVETPRAPRIRQFKAAIRSQLIDKGGPTPKKDKTIMVSAKDGSDVLAKFMEAVKPGNIGIEISNVRPTRGGRIALDIPEQADHQVLQDNEDLKKAGLEVTIAPHRLPRMTIFDVPTTWSGEELVEAFMENSIPNIPKEKVKEQFIPVYKVGPKDKPMTHWVVQVSPVMRKHLLDIGRVKLIWFSCRIQDNINVSRCYKCQLYGHVSSVCRNKQICGWCAGLDHAFRDCPNRQKTPCCVNCKAALMECSHDAGSSGCPSLKKAIQQYVRATDYGT